MDPLDPRLGRRGFLGLLAAAPILVGKATPQVWAERLASAESMFAASNTATRPKPTPECADDDEPTPSETAGPFYKPRSPKRASLIEAGMRGTPLVVSGRVFARNCKPVPGALLDFWHCDDQGEYDNDGFRLRGHQFADREGRFQLETIVPGTYPGRTRHIHVKVQAPEGRVLTTQLYFPGEPRNQRDGLFMSELVMKMSFDKRARQGRFLFLLES